MVAPVDFRARFPGRRVALLQGEALYADRASHYCQHARGAAARWPRITATQVGRALQQLGIEHESRPIRPRPARCSAPCRTRLASRNQRSASPTAGANRFLKDSLPATTQRPLRRPLPVDWPAPSCPATPAIRRRHLCIHAHVPLVARDNTVRYKALALQIPALLPPRTPPLRQGRSASTNTRTVASRTGPLARYTRRWLGARSIQPETRRRPRDLASTRPSRRPVAKWTAVPRLTTSPQGHQPQQKRNLMMCTKTGQLWDFSTAIGRAHANIARDRAISGR